MAETDEAPARPKRGGRAKTPGEALTAARQRVGGDNNGESGDNASPEAGDKGGEFARQTYTLDEQQREALADAKGDDRTAGSGNVAQAAFWRAAGDRLGFNPITVEESEDIGQSGEFTAFPADNVIPQGTGDLHQQHETALERMEQSASAAVLNDRSLVFDVRDFLLEQIKARPKPWSATSADEQRDVAAACEHAGKELVRKILEALAARDPQKVRVLLTKINIGDDIVIAGKVKPLDPAEEDEAVTILHHARGKHVMLTVASADDHMEGGREPGIQPDQPDLDFEAGNDEDLAGERDEDEDEGERGG